MSEAGSPVVGVQRVGIGDALEEAPGSRSTTVTAAGETTGGHGPHQQGGASLRLHDSRAAPMTKQVYRHDATEPGELPGKPQSHGHAGLVMLDDRLGTAIDKAHLKRGMWDDRRPLPIDTRQSRTHVYGTRGPPGGEVTSHRRAGWPYPVLGLLLVLTWLAVPLDEGDGKLQDELFAFGFHGIYAAGSYAVAVVGYGLVLPLPPMRRVIVAGVATLIVPHSVAVYWVLQVSTEEGYAKRLNIAAALLAPAMLSILYFGTEAALLHARESGRRTMCCGFVAVAEEDAGSGASTVSDDGSQPIENGEPEHPAAHITSNTYDCEDPVTPARSQFPEMVAGTPQRATSTVVDFVRGVTRMAKSMDEDTSRKPLAIFVYLFMVLTLILTAYYFCQSFTVVFLLHKDDLTEIEKGALIVLFLLTMFSFRIVAGRIAASRVLRSRWEVSHNALLMMLGYTIELMGLLFQRHLFQSFGDLRVVVATLCLRLAGHVYRGPVRLSFWYYKFYKWIWRQRCCRSSAVQPGGASLPTEEALRNGFLRRSENVLVSHLYEKIAAALSLMSWYVFAAFYRYGWNARVFSLGAGRDSLELASFLHVSEVAALFVVFESLAVLFVWIQASRVHPELWSRATKRVWNAQWRKTALLTVLSVHVIQDASLALVNPNVL